MTQEGSGTARGGGPGRRPARIAERFGLIVLGLFLALIVLEIALQIGAAYVRGTAYDRRSGWTGQARHIVSVGDSNTYGTFTRHIDAYPKVLERLWNGQAGRTEVDVLNLGIPGTNSSTLRINLRGLLASLRPDVVLVLIGANDPWTVPVPLGQARQLTLQQRLWNHSRVFRLLYMVFRTIRGVDSQPLPKVIVKRAPKPQDARGVVRLGDEEFDLTWTGRAKTSPRGWAAALRANLVAMREYAEENGTQIVMLTYASEQDAYGLANQVIRAASSDDLPVIDVARVFSALCHDDPCPDLFFPDGHPTRLGYQIVAATVWRGLARLHEQPTEPRDEASWSAVLDAEVRRRLASLPPDG